MRLRHIWPESIEALLARRWKTVLAGLGVAVGIAAAVGVISVAGSGEAAVRAEFDALRATEVSVRYATEVPAGLITTDRRRRLEAFPDVKLAGLIAQAREADVVVSRGGTSSIRPNVGSVFAAEPSALDIEGATLVSGRIYDSGHAARGELVAVAGAALADELLVHGRQGGGDNEQITVAGTPVTILGVVDHPDAVSATSLYFAYPPPTLISVLNFATPEWRISIQPGAAEQLVRDIPLALLPEMPDRVLPLAAVEPVTLRGRVESRTQSLVLGVAGVTLLAGVASIATSQRVAVMQRRPEIGLRRALGASARDVLMQFLLEGGVVGFFGGAVGGLLGAGAGAAVAVARGWPLVLPVALVVASPIVGAFLGLVAAAPPAAVAARVSPSEALRD